MQGACIEFRSFSRVPQVGLLIIYDNARDSLRWFVNETIARAIEPFENRKTPNGKIYIRGYAQRGVAGVERGYAPDGKLLISGA